MEVKAESILGTWEISKGDNNFWTRAFVVPTRLRRGDETLISNRG